jgi:hypothetical protein
MQAIDTGGISNILSVVNTAQNSSKIKIVQTKNFDMDEKYSLDIPPPRPPKAAHLRSSGQISPFYLSPNPSPRPNRKPPAPEPDMEDSE